MNLKSSDSFGSMNTASDFRNTEQSWFARASLQDLIKARVMTKLPRRSFFRCELACTLKFLLFGLQMIFFLHEKNDQFIENSKQLPDTELF